MYFTRRQIQSGLCGLSLVFTACVPSAARHGTQGVNALLADRDDARFATVQLGDSAAVALIPAGPLTLDTAARIALVKSPHVRVVLADVGLAAADLWQASRLPNPTLDASYGFPKGDEIGLTGIGVGFSIISALQMPLTRRVAALEFRSAERQVADAVYGTVLNVQRAFVDVQYAQQMLELRQTVAAVTSASAGVAKALRDAGNIPELSVAAEDAMAAEMVGNVAMADAHVASTRAELTRLLGGGIADTLWSITGRMADPSTASWPLALADSLALSRRFDIAAARENAEAAAAAIGLRSRFRYLPDGTIGAAYERGPDGTFVGPSASLTLPLFDGGGAAVAKARAQFTQRAAIHDALVVNAHAEVRTALANVESARRRAVQYRTVVLPARRRVVTESQLQVNAMSLSVFALLQARQAEVDAGQMYLDALRDYWFARAELERATGGPLPAGATR